MKQEKSRIMKNDAALMVCLLLEQVIAKTHGVSGAVLGLGGFQNGIESSAWAHDFLQQFIRWFVIATDIDGLALNGS